MLGIIEPNDGLCHLDNLGNYTFGTKQDYPSISQTNLKAKENHINIIFAVTSKHHSIYKNLAENIEGSYAAELVGNSTNIVNIIKDQYKVSIKKKMAYAFCILSYYIYR